MIRIKDSAAAGRDTAPLTLDGLDAPLWQVAADPELAPQLHDLLGEFCDKARNRLNSMNLALFLAKRQEPVNPSRWETLDQSYYQTLRLVEQVQTICRPITLSPMRLDLGLMLEDRRRDWEVELEAVGQRLHWQPPKEPVEGWVDPSRLVSALDTWVKCRAGRGSPGSSVRLSWRAIRGDLAISWEEQLVANRTRGTREKNGDSASLALPILARILQAHGGRSTLSMSQGLCLVLQWPKTGPAATA